MPDHMHLILWPYGDSSISDIMRDYKKFTSKRIIRQAEVERIDAWTLAFAQAGRETGRSDNKVWPDSYWDVNIFSERFLRQKIDYLHYNPVRAGLVAEPRGGYYPYSSFQNYEIGQEWLMEIDQQWG